MNIKSELQQLCGDTQNLRLNDVNIEPETIQAIMINEVVPSCPEDDFYGKPDSAYMSTTIPMFRKAGIEVGLFGTGYSESRNLHYQCCQDT